jgi:4-hydroxy-tetrahydrodipicolinate reductase
MRFMVLHLYVNGIRGRMGKAIVQSLDPAKHVIVDAVSKSDIVIDFSSPSALELLLDTCLSQKKGMVIGTTGYHHKQFEWMQNSSLHIPIFYSSNFSFGMALFQEMLEMASSRLDSEVSIEIVETHHTLKKDKPSGTALTLASKTKRPSVPIHSIRAGDIVGDHMVLIGLAGERIEMKHQAHSRLAFAKGALKAAEFVDSKPPGYYTMKDLLYASC